ncbi:MAG: DUF502 domain-containing protein [Gammaproteobacteria bacterium]
MFKSLRRYLVTGVIIWVPVIVTVLVVRFLLRLMDRTLVVIPPAYQPETLLGFNIPGLGLLLSLVILFLTGLLAANLFGRKLVSFSESILARIPLVRSIYASAKQVAETVLSDGDTSFKRVMLVQYPRKGVWSLCFQTATDLAEIQSRTESEVVCVFVPTTPNPTSGFILFVPRKDLINLDMSVDEGLRMIISLGVVVPRWRHPEDLNALAPAQPET